MQENHDNSFRILENLVICAAAAFVVLGTCIRPYSELAYSRLATVYSLTEYGSFYLEGPNKDMPNPFLGTVDKVMVRGKKVGGAVEDGYLISSKPPLMPLLMAGEYLVLNKLLGWNLENEADVNRVVCVMTMTLVGTAYVLGLIFFLKLLHLGRIEPLARLMLVSSLAFGTQLWGFSSTLNNHVPAAGLLIVALYLAIGLVSGTLAPTAWRFALFGLVSAMVATLDLPSGIYPFLAGLVLLWRFPLRTLTWGVLGAAGPLAVHFGVMLWVTGSPLPVQVYKETYLYEGSPWLHPMGIDGLSEPRLTYLFHMTFGRCGIFSLYPVLLAGAAAALRALVRRSMPWRGWIVGGAVAFLVVTAYYALRTDNYGGECYGFRWYIVSMPVLLLMGAPLLSGMRKRWQWIFVGILLGVSFYSAWECTSTGWVSSQEWTCRIFGPSI